MADGAQRVRVTPFALFLIVGLALAWGCNWSMIKLALDELPPWTYRWTTCGTAGVLLILIERARGGVWLPHGREWGRLALLSAFNTTIWQMAVAFAVLSMGTGRGAILAFTMPVWAALIAVLVLGERLTRRLVLTLALAVAGILLLLLRDIAAVGDSPFGIAMALTAAFGWAVATLYQKHNRFEVGVFAFAGWQQLIGAIPIMAMAFAHEPLVPPLPSAAAFAAIGYSIAAGYIFAYFAWFTLVGMYPVHVASVSSLLVPAVSVATGALLLAEPFGWREAAALLLIGAAVALVLVLPARTVAARQA